MVTKSLVHNRVFGGFTSLNWTSETAQTLIDDTALLFSVNDTTIYPVKQGESAIIHLPDDGPSFFDLKF
jgi:hypothetical protein